MRFNDAFRRRVIVEIRLRAQVVRDPSEPGFHTYGARSYAFAGVAHRLSSAGIALDIRRMWQQWVVSFHKYKTRKTSRRPKFYHDLHFLNGQTMDHLSSVAARF